MTYNDLKSTVKTLFGECFNSNELNTSRAEILSIVNDEFMKRKKGLEKVQKKERRLGILTVDYKSIETTKYYAGTVRSSAIDKKQNNVIIFGEDNAWYV